jgi:hypothetical protein
LATYDKVEEGIEWAGLEHQGDDQKGGEEGGNDFSFWQQCIIEHTIYGNIIVMILETSNTEPEMDIIFITPSIVFGLNVVLECLCNIGAFFSHLCHTQYCSLALWHL